MKKETEQLSASEYRKRAEEHFRKVIAIWKLFGKIGVFVLATVAVVIGVALAWFASNNQVSSGTATIQGAANSTFELAAAGTLADTGEWDEKLASMALMVPGEEKNLFGKTYVTTEGKSTIRWAITGESHMENQANTENSPSGIHPGMSGTITFYIIPKASGDLTVTLDVNLTGLALANNQDNQTEQEVKILTKSPPEDAQELLEGHLLLFAAYDSDRNAYGGWISEDAIKWRMNLDYGKFGTAVLERIEGTRLTWKASVEEGTPYPVTLYWIWPEVLGQYLLKPEHAADIGNRSLLFPDASDSLESTNPYAIPADLITKMCNTTVLGNSNRYFKWPADKKEEFEGTVNEAVLSGFREGNYSKVTYGKLCDYYNRADQYLGLQIRYLNLAVDAQ